MGRGEGFNLRQFRVLFAEGLERALTGGREGGHEAGDDGSRHILGAAYGLTLSTTVAVVLHARAEPGLFLLVTMTISMVFAALAVIQELAAGLFSPQDLAVTGHLPISGLTRFAARFASFGCVLALLTLNLNLGPAILLGFKPGAGPAAFVIVLAAAGAATLFTAAAGLLLYLFLMRVLRAYQLENALLYLNVLFSLAILGLILNAGALLQARLLREASSGGWPAAFPPAWFAALALRALGLAPEAASAWPGLLATAGAALLLGAAAAVSSGPLLRAMTGARGRGAGRSAPGLAMRAFERLLVRPRERAAFEFTAIQLARDRGFRLRAYPILGFPVLILLFGLTERRDLFFFIVMLHLVNLYLPLVVTFLPFGDDFAGAWIFDSLPAPGRATFSLGVEKAFLFRIALPLGALDAMVLALTMPPWDAALNAAFALLAGLFVVAVSFARMKSFPFTLEFRGALPVQGPQDSLLLGVLFIVLLAALQAWSAVRPGLLAGEVLLMLILHKLRFARAARRAEQEGAQ